MSTVTVEAHHIDGLIFFEVVKDLGFDPFDTPVELLHMPDWPDPYEVIEPDLHELLEVLSERVEQSAQFTSGLVPLEVEVGVGDEETVWEEK